MQDFSTEFFFLLEVLAGSYLVSKSLTSLCLLTTVYNWHQIILAYLYHFVMCIMHSCRYYIITPKVFLRVQEEQGAF